MTRPWPFRAKGALQRQLWHITKGIKQGQPEPLVVVGDFNSTASGALLDAFARELELAPAAAPLGDWPTPLPAPFRIAIENAFAGHGETIVERTLGQPNGSDHQPIVFEVAPARSGK